MHFNSELARIELDRDYGINPLIAPCDLCGEHRAPKPIVPAAATYCRHCTRDMREDFAFRHPNIADLRRTTAFDAIFILI